MVQYTMVPKIVLLKELPIKLVMHSQEGETNRLRAGDPLPLSKALGQPLIPV